MSAPERAVYYRGGPPARRRGPHRRSARPAPACGPDLHLRHERQHRLHFLVIPEAGQAVTVHKAQGVTMDRVYVLADPVMDRHAAYVALTRHRQGVDLFADRETFPSREYLDKVLSRSGHKDLASDYASADLRRAVTRLKELAVKTTRAPLEERPLRDTLAALETLRGARQRVVESRRSLAEPTG